MAVDLYEMWNATKRTVLECGMQGQRVEKKALQVVAMWTIADWPTNTDHIEQPDCDWLHCG